MDIWEADLGVGEREWSLFGVINERRAPTVAAAIRITQSKTYERTNAREILPPFPRDFVLCRIVKEKNVMVGFSNR